MSGWSVAVAALAGLWAQEPDTERLQFEIEMPGTLRDLAQDRRTGKLFWLDGNGETVWALGADETEPRRFAEFRRTQRALAVAGGFAVTLAEGPARLTALSVADPSQRIEIEGEGPTADAWLLPSGTDAPKVWLIRREAEGVTGQALTLDDLADRWAPPFFLRVVALPEDRWAFSPRDEVLYHADGMRVEALGIPAAGAPLRAERALLSATGAPLVLPTPTGVLVGATLCSAWLGSSRLHLGGEWSAVLPDGSAALFGRGGSATLVDLLRPERRRDVSLPAGREVDRAALQPYRAVFFGRAAGRTRAWAVPLPEFEPAVPALAPGSPPPLIAFVGEEWRWEPGGALPFTAEASAGSPWSSDAAAISWTPGWESTTASRTFTAVRRAEGAVYREVAEVRLARRSLTCGAETARPGWERLRRERLEASPDGSRVYWLAGWIGVLRRVDPAESRIAWETQIGAPCADLAVLEDALWVSSPERRSLVEVDPESGEVRQEINLEEGAPRALAVGGGAALYAACAEHRTGLFVLVRLDVRRGRRERIELDLPGSPPEAPWRMSLHPGSLVDAAGLLWRLSGRRIEATRRWGWGDEEPLTDESAPACRDTIHGGGRLYFGPDFRRYAAVPTTTLGAAVHASRPLLITLEAEPTAAEPRLAAYRWSDRLQLANLPVPEVSPGALLVIADRVVVAGGGSIAWIPLPALFPEESP